MSLFLQQLIGGLTFGSIYAALALALVLVFRSTGVVNFAQGSMALVTTYFAWQLSAWGLPVLLSVILVLVIAFLLGAFTEFLVIRRVDTKNHWAIIILTFGIFLILNMGVGVIWGYDAKSMSHFSLPMSTRIGSIVLTGHDLVVVVTLLAEAVGLWYLFRYTKLGLGFRATVSSRQEAQLMGIRVGQMTTLGWGLAAVLGAVCGLLTAPRVLLEPGLMFAPLVYALAAIALGGLDSPLGAVLASLVIGVSTNLARAYLPWIGSELAIGVPLVIMVVVLLFRPQGMFGSAKLVRV